MFVPVQHVPWSWRTGIGVIWRHPTTYWLMLRGNELRVACVGEEESNPHMEDCGI